MKETSAELDYLNTVLDRTHNLISRCDQKISIVLALLGGFLALSLGGENLNTYEHIVENLDQVLTGRQILYFVMFSLAVFLCVTALICLTVALTARIVKSNSMGSFSAVKRYNRGQLKDKILFQHDKKRLDDVADEIYVNYKVAREKHIWFNIGLWISVAGVILLISTHLWSLGL